MVICTHIDPDGERGVGDGSVLSCCNSFKTILRRDIPIEQLFSGRSGSIVDSGTKNDYDTSVPCGEILDNGAHHMG